jgi:hypothetical protein
MTVTVTLTTRDVRSLKPTVETFGHEDDQYHLYDDGKLEVHRHDGTVKVFMPGSFSTVDGKRMPPSL